VLTEVVISGHRNVTTKEGEKTRKYDINIGHVERKKRSCTSNEGANLNHLKIIRRIHEKVGGKVLYP